MNSIFKRTFLQYFTLIYSVKQRLLNLDDTKTIPTSDVLLPEKLSQNIIRKSEVLHSRPFKRIFICVELLRDGM